MDQPRGGRSRIQGSRPIPPQQCNRRRDRAVMMSVRRCLILRRCMCVAGHIASGTRGRLGGSASGFHATIAPQHDRVGNHVTTLTPFPAGLPTPACNPAVSPSDCTHSHAQRLSEPVVARWIIPWVFPTVFPAADAGILATLDTTTPSIKLHNSLASKPPQTLLTVDFAEHLGC